MISTGDIANVQGDILFSGKTLIAAGLIALPIHQALVALRYGWGWIGTHDMYEGPWILIQRGGERWEVRE